LSRVYINAGRDGDAGDYLQGGRIEVANNRRVEVRVRDSETEPGPTNIVYTPIRFLDDGDPASVDGLVVLANDQALETYHGTVVLDRLELAPGSYAGLNPNPNNQDRYGAVNSIVVLGTGTEATLGVWATGSGAGYNRAEIDSSLTPVLGMQNVGLVRLKDIQGGDASNVLNIRGQTAQNQGKRFRMEGELGIDVNLNPGNQSGFGTHLVPGFDLAGHTLTMDTPGNTNAGDYRLWTDPGQGRIIKHGGNDLDIYWGHNNSEAAQPQPWNTNPGELEITLRNNSGLRVYVDEGLENMGNPVRPTGVNELPATIRIEEASNAQLRAESALSFVSAGPLQALPGEVWVHKLVLGAAMGIQRRAGHRG